MPQDISVIVLALNEEKNIAAAVESVIGAIRDIVDDYEIIVMDDGSTDRTGLIAESIAAQNSRVKVFHNEQNRGYGYSYRKGLSSASKTYVTTFSGDNDMSGESLRNLVKEMGKAEVICSYYNESCNHRTLWRRAVSRAFVMVINALFQMDHKYYNGSSICRLAVVRSLALKSNGMAVNTECLVKLLKLGYSHKAIPFDHVGRTGGRSTALSLKSMKETARTLGILFNDIYFSSHKITRLKEASHCQVP